MNSANVCQHYEWAYPPGRKIDAATNVNGDDFRNRVANAGKPAPSAKSGSQHMMLVEQSSTGHMWLVESGGGKADEGDFGRRTLIPASEEAAWKASGLAYVKAGDALFSLIADGRQRRQ